MMHSFGRSIGWHLGTILVDTLGPAAIVIAVLLGGAYLYSRIRRRRRTR